MPIIDITVPLSDAPVIPEYRPLVVPLEPIMSLFSVQFVNNTATHVEIPEKIKYQNVIEKLNGNCRVIVIKSSSPEISVRDLQSLKPAIKPGSRVLFKTRNSPLMRIPTIQPDFVTFSEAAVQYLADRQLDLVGFDYIFLDRDTPQDSSLRDLFIHHRIPLLLGIQLEAVPPGNYKLSCLPLKLLQSRILPASAVLSTER